MMGGPHKGALKAVDAIYSGPRLLPFGLLAERLGRVLATFPSMYQILPSYPCAVDKAGTSFSVLADEAWLGEERRHLLRDAQLLRSELGEESSVKTLSIFGYGQKTLTGISVERDPAGRWRRAGFKVEAAGDRTTPEVSAIFKLSDIHPVRQEHGSLYVDNDVKKRLKIELTA